MRTLFFITFFVVQSFSLWAAENNQQPTTYTKEDCQQLMDEAYQETDNKKYTSALEKLLKAELMAEENGWDDKLWLIKNRIGLIYVYHSNFGEALEYYQESYTLTQKHVDLQENGALPLINMAILYGREENYEEAINYGEIALALSKKNKSDDFSERKAIVASLAKFYTELQQTEKAFELLATAKSAEEASKFDFMWQTRYIYALFKDGQIDKAQQEVEQLYTDFKLGKYTDYRGECYTCMYQLLATIYDTPKTRGKAIFYTEKALSITDDLKNRVSLFKKMVRLLEQKDNYSTASVYKDSIIYTTDSLNTVINRDLYEINKVKFKVQEYQSEILANKVELMATERQQKTERILFVVLSLLGIVVFFSTYRAWKNKMIKQKQKAKITKLALEKEKKDHLLAEKELETQRLKQQQLKHEIAEKNRELSAKALYLSNRNQLINEIIETLEDNKSISKNKEVLQQVGSVKKLLKNDKYIEDFSKHFEKVNPEFLKQLKEEHAKLNTNDIRFLCYVFMNLNLKEISTLLNITYNACEKRNRRIKAKMGIDKDTVLYDYILGLANNLTAAN